MATTIYNDAEAIYQFSGSPEVNTISSNTNSIELLENTGLTITKVANPGVFSAGDIIDYTVTITNNSSQYLNGVRIIDNLGNGNLAYVLGSGRLTVGSLTYPVNPVSTNPLTFTLQQLGVGATMVLSYKAQVIFNLPNLVSSITNVIQGIGYTSTGTITGGASTTIQKKNSANLVFEKTASADSVFENVLFNYYLTFTNNSSKLAIINSITDELPSNFVVGEIKLKIGSGAEVVLNATDYTIAPGNVLTIPSATGPFITVPENQETVITVSGYFN